MRLLYVFACVVAFASLTESALAANFLEDNPTRPNDAQEVKATVGTFLGYKLVANNETLSPKLRIWDAIEKRERVFSMSFRSTVNGVGLHCESDPGIPGTFFTAQAVASENHLCATLPPEFVAGHTTLLVIYWDPKTCKNQDRLLTCADPLPGSDSITIVPPLSGAK